MNGTSFVFRVHDIGYHVDGGRGAVGGRGDIYVIESEIRSHAGVDFDVFGHLECGR